MTRYLRLYLHFLRFSFSKAMEFRVDFFFRVVMDMCFYGVNLGFFWVLYQHTPTVGGWDLDQTLIFISAFFLIDAIHMTVFANNMWMLPFLINKGDLDYYLVRPVSSLFFLSFREFAANSFLNLLIASGILAWALARYPHPLTAQAVVTFLLLVVAGVVLYWLLYLLFLIPTFWTHAGSGLRQLFFGLEKFSERPDQIFTGWLHRTLTTLLPFALIASYPTHVLFEPANPLRVVHILVVIAAMFVAVLFMWNRGLRSYASASS
ncbi:ABC-2 family transporter protein [Planctomycetota bacterium]|nr:ABC-2 family transporter protein [Planctomycetota bacterium]